MINTTLQLCMILLESSLFTTFLLNTFFFSLKHLGSASIQCYQAKMFVNFNEPMVTCLLFIFQMRTQFEVEMSDLCQQLLGLQASMHKEQTRVESILKEKDKCILKQKQELDKLNSKSNNPSSLLVASTAPNVSTVSSTPSSVSVTSLSGLSPVALGGSLRIHGSFRQYKKDREKIRQQLKSSPNSSTTLISDSSSSSGININSSEESSSSPSTLPRAQKGALRQTLSSGSVEDSSNKKKGILKPLLPKSSNDNHVQEVLTHLDQLIEPPPSKSTKIQISPQAPEDKSDSGRESDDIEPLNNSNTIIKSSKSTPNISVVTVSATDSANSSFDGADPTLSWKINVKSEEHDTKKVKPVNPVIPAVKKVKPPPPPRSSQTRLSTIKPKSILSPTSSLNPEMTPTEALDNLIHNNSKLRQSENKKKRVKFNPRIDTSTGDPASAADVPSIPSASNTTNLNSSPLDPNFLHFLPRLSQKQETAKKIEATLENSVNQSNNSRNFSYYEPYI